jgi:prepilin-type N-terminal cleavage/methylation domain-containing protein
MNSGRTPSGFTLIELLTVIAIIAVLAAIIFPVAGTVREQARASSCMTQLHQLWVAANVYRQDEGGYPPALLGYAEQGVPDNNGVCTGTVSNGDPYDPGVNNGCAANLDRLVNGFMYPEQFNDSNLVLCPDNIPRPSKNLVTIAHFPPKPVNWPANYNYITDASSDPNAPVNVCGSDAAGLIDCFTSGPNQGKPKYYYVWDSYDIGPRVNPDGTPFLINGQRVYDVHYSLNWTGVTGMFDLPVQLKYSNPPTDKTILTYCTWHSAVANTGSVTAVSLAGTAKKIPVAQIVANGPNVFNR